MKNKYQEALDIISSMNIMNYLTIDERSLTKSLEAKLQELVDKETPINPIGLEDEYNGTYVIKFTHMCSHCNDNFLSTSDKYCKECGQKIDWSNEE